MHRGVLFILIILAGVLAGLSSVATFQPDQSMMFGMRGMMGDRSGVIVFLSPLILSTSMAVAAIALTYVILYPSIKYSTSSRQEKEIASNLTTKLDPMDIVMRVAKPDERVALEVLRNSGWICLQKDITYKTGLSKLKTHRIVARLADRGIIQVKKVGKTNEISVPAWLKTETAMSEPPQPRRREQLPS